VDIEDLVETGVQRGGEHARGGGLTRAHFAGEQARAGMLGQEFEPGLDLLPGGRGEQLFGVGRSEKGVFLKPKTIPTLPAGPSVDHPRPPGAPAPSGFPSQ